MRGRIRRSVRSRTCRRHRERWWSLGCLPMAGLVGLLMGSWTWFVLATIVCVAASVHSGDIGCGRPADHPGRAADGAVQGGPAPGPRTARGMV